jgi:anionic cell wall polymer biosynthesis LytR-Cps2A-Psr (LCP) family protein
LSNKKLLLTLGAGYICTHVSNVRRTKINENLKCYNNENEDLSIFILNNNTYENLLMLNFNKEKNKVKIANFYMNKRELSEFYNKNGEIETIKLLNLENSLSINNYIKFDYRIIKEYVDKINGLNLRITAREARLLKLEMNESNTYIFNGEKIIEYLTLDYVGADKSKRLKRVLKILLDNVFELSKKDFINTISEIMTNIETSLSIKDLVSLGVYSLKLNSSDIEEYNFEVGEKLLVVQ